MRRRSSAVAVLLAVLGLGMPLVGGSPAGADELPSCPGGEGWAFCGFTGGLQTFTVPADVSRITIEAFGAMGGAFDSNLGALVIGTFAVTPGDELTVLAGGVGGTAVGNAGAAGGYGGGGDGADAPNALGRGGAGGGGGSFVFGPSHELLLAAGGGAGSPTAGRADIGFFSDPQWRCWGGWSGLDGADGYGNTTTATMCTPRRGRGGTQTSAGAGGDAITGTEGSAPAAGAGSGPARWTADGPVAGTGGAGSASQYIGGTGGGGGYYGGGGSTSAGGGGGGSSYVSPAATNVAIDSNVGEEGSVSITYTAGPEKLDQTITFDTPTNVTHGDPDRELGATASSGLPVTYVSETPAYCKIVDDKLHAVAEQGGTCTIAALQPGNELYNPAGVVWRTFTIAPNPTYVKAPQTIAFTAPTGLTYGDGDTVLGATASSGLPVTYTADTPLVCTVGGGAAHIVTAGSCTITVDQSGSATVAPAPPETRTFTIARAGQAITIATPTGATVGDVFRLDAAASSGLAVEYASETPDVCIFEDGWLHVDELGTCALTVDQAGDSNYEPATRVAVAFDTAAATTPIVTTPCTVSFADGAGGYAYCWYTGGLQTFTVPSRVETVRVEALGAAGGPLRHANYGGYGAATVDVEPGEELTVLAGGVGGGALLGENAAGGYGGGGDSSVKYLNDFWPGGGGGGTFVFDGDHRLLVAGGGGGGDGDGYRCIGGAGGGATGWSIPCGWPGGGGSQSAGGSGGDSHGGAGSGPAGWRGGRPVVGTGGNGAGSSSGGGGGGFYGGGGGWLEGGGGGGSGYVAPFASDGVLEASGGSDYDGYVIISFTYSSPPMSDQTITFDAPTDVTYGDADLDLGATASSGLPVTYSSTTPDVCTIVTSRLHAVAAGSCTVDANQPGNDSYNPAPQVERTFAIAPAAQTITFTAPASITYGDADADLGATASSGLAVSYASETPTVCTIVAGALHVVGAGSCSIDADQVGDTNYDAAPRVVRTFVIARAAQTITFMSSPPNPALFGGTYVPAATGGASGNPVVLTIHSSSDAGACRITSGTVSFTGPGRCMIAADQTEGPNHTAAHAEQSFTIGFTSSLRGKLKTLTVKAGEAVYVAPGTTVGAVTVETGGALFASGVKVTGTLTATSALAIRLCGVSVSSNLSITKTTGLVVVGQPVGAVPCAGNTLAAKATITDNLGGVVVVGNTVKGSLTVTGNTGTIEVSGNKVSGAVKIQS